MNEKSERKVYVKYNKKNGMILGVVELEEPLREGEEIPFRINQKTEAAELLPVPRSLSKERITIIHKRCWVDVKLKNPKLKVKSKKSKC